MEVSLVIPTYNRREIVRRSLETLFNQDFPASDFEIIAVVDGSIDGTAQTLRNLKPKCRFRVIEQENRGLAGARNTGFRAAKSELVLFLDDDMRADPGLVGAHVRAHQRLGPAAVFGSLFLSQDSTANLASECFRREIGAFHLRRSLDPNQEWGVSECVFSNSSIPKQILANAGGFDESFRMREDLELGMRLRALGVRMEYADEAVAYQYYNKTSADLLEDARKFAVADLMFERKYPGQRIEGLLRVSDEDLSWKRSMRAVLSRSPVLEKTLLAPLCVLGDACFWFIPLRWAGVRALQMRRRIHWLRALRGIAGSGLR
ncbi:MAG TPA: glycosyltransferase family 2 protein [Terracidiphilus sp.]|nr:glycosyltransferase family 2 protein [Terracidiphilus sp.]